MRRLICLIALLALPGSLRAEPARGAYPSANVQFLPAFVALEKGFYKHGALAVDSFKHTAQAAGARLHGSALRQ